MEKEQLLKVLANRFYLNIPTSVNPEIREYSDKEYDELVDAWEAETGRKVKELVDWEDTKIERTPIEPLNKEKYEPEQILSTIKADFAGRRYHINYKYDGCSVEAVYTETGRLKQILGTPDEAFGFIRTEKLGAFFPEKVTPGVHRLFGEVLVSTDKYGQLARNQANGICNSKYLQDKIDEEAFVRVYNIEFYDKQWNYVRLCETLDSLPLIYKERNGRTELVFAQAERLPDSAIVGEPLIVEKSEVSYLTSELGVFDTVEAESHFQVDGYVVYAEDEVFAYKMYYTEFQDVVIKNIEWNYNWVNGSYIPKAQYDGVTLNDKWNTQAAIGGITKMVDEGIGIGAKIRVVMSGGTIPKIIKVLEPSDNFAWPTCQCGHQLSKEHQVGAVLKCPNPTCCLKIDQINDEICSFLGWERIEPEEEGGRPTFRPTGVRFGDKLDEDLFFIIRLLHIDRFKPENKFKVINPWEKNSRIVDSVNSKGFSREGLREQINSLVSEVESQEACYSAVVNYQENHTDEAFDSAVEILNKYITYGDEAESFETAYKTAVLSLLENPSVAQFELLCSNFFNMSSLQRTNARLNMEAVLKAIEQFK